MRIRIGQPTIDLCLLDDHTGSIAFRTPRPPPAML